MEEDFGAPEEYRAEDFVESPVPSMNTEFGEPEDFDPANFKQAQPIEEFGDPEDIGDNLVKPERLKEDDLTRPDLTKKIRGYMVKRNGVDYEEMEDDRLIRDFLNTQRYIDSGNSATLITEAMFLNKLNDEERAEVADAYKLFEDLDSSIFSKEADTVEGLRDYAGAILMDPVNLVGIGVGKLLTGGAARTASMAVRQAAKLSRARVIQEATAAGASSAVAAQAGKYTFRKTIEQGLRNQTIKQYAVTGGLEAAVIGAQDAGRQRVRQMADPDRKFNYAEFGVASALGLAGGVASVALQKLGPNLSRTDYSRMLNKKVTPEQTAAIKRAAFENILTMLKETDWLAAAAKGRQLLGNDGTLDGSVFKEVVLGSKEAGTKGIIDFMQAAGIKVETRISQSILNFLKDVPPELKRDFDAAFAEASKGAFGSVADFSDKFAATIRKAGQDNQVMTQARMAFDKKVMANSVLEEELTGLSKAENDKLDDIIEGSYASYFQNVWKRVIVANLKTTAVNVAGSSTYVAGNSARDVLYATAYTIAGNFSKAKQHLGVLKDRAKFLFADSMNDVSQNRLIFEEIMKIDPKSFEPLRRTVNMGIAQPEDFEKMLKAYKFEELSPAAKKALKYTENTVDFLQKVTLVQTQDMFFKSFGLRDNLNRIARLKYGRSLDDIMVSGDFKRLFTSNDFGEAVHRTLQLTLSADYTSRNKAFNKTNEALSMMARGIENFSNTPGFGFVLPFGKFVNNVIATSYQYAPIIPSAVEVVKYYSAKGLRKKNVKFDGDAFTNGIVGLAATIGAYQYANSRRENNFNDPWHIARLPNGDRIDIRNTYPASAIAVFGEVAYRWINDEPIDTILARDFGEQVALGQVAEDLNIIDVVESIVSLMVQTPGDFISNRSGTGGVISQDIGTFIGSVVSGLTRPLEAVNDAIGIATGDLDVLDRRILDKGGSLSRGAQAMQMEAARYTDKIFKMFSSTSESDVDPDLKLRFEATKTGTSTKPNPFSKALVFGESQGARTYSEKMLEMAQLAPWMANFRSQHPHFNRLANEYISPLLELYAKDMIKSGSLERKDPAERRVRVQAVLRGVQKEAKDRIENGVKPGHREYALERELLGIRENRVGTDAFETGIRELGLSTKDPLQMTLKDKVDLLERIKAIQERNAY